jgi:hypothetical protein
MVKCASGNDTDTHSMVRLGSGADGLGYLMVMITLAKTVSVTYRHWITHKFLVSECTRLSFNVQRREGGDFDNQLFSVTWRNTAGPQSNIIKGKIQHDKTFAVAAANQFNVCNVAKLKQDYRVAKRTGGEGERGREKRRERERRGEREGES